MPPVNDAFADSIDITTLGDPGCLFIEGTLVDATASAAETAFFGFPVVWYHFDVPSAWSSSATDGLLWSADFYSGRGAIGDDGYAVILLTDVDGTIPNLVWETDVSYDQSWFGTPDPPNAYDWYKSDFMTNPGGGYRLYFAVGLDGAGSPGPFKFDMGLGPYRMIFEAESYINPDSPTAVSLGTTVKETQRSEHTDAVPDRMLYEKIDTLTINNSLIKTGVYIQMSARARRVLGNGQGGDHEIGVSRNGQLVGMVGTTDNFGEVAGTYGFQEILSTDITGSPGSYGDGPGGFGDAALVGWVPAELGLIEGDEIGLRVGWSDTPSTNTEYFEIDYVHLQRGFHKHLAINEFPRPTIGLGTTYLTGSHLGLGMAGPDISDEITANHGADGRSGNVDFDICITDDGTLWMVTVEDTFSVNVAQNRYAVRLLKWNGAAWSVVDNDVWTHGNPSAAGAYFVWHCRIDTDGTDVWVMWAETPQAGSDSFEVKVRKRNVTAGTWDSILTRARPAGQPTTWDGGGFTSIPTFKVAPNGDLWVFYPEYDAANLNGDGAGQRPIWGFYYDGSWHEAHPPQPALNGTRTAYDTGFVEDDSTDQAVVVFQTPDGPSDYPTIVFVGTQFGGTSGSVGDLCYTKWNGSAWSTLLQTPMQDIWPDYITRVGSEDLNWQQGHRLLAGTDGQIFWCGALGHGVQNTLDSILAAKLNDDEDGWDSLGMPGAPWDLERGSAAGPWGRFSFQAELDDRDRIWTFGADFYDDRECVSRPNGWPGHGHEYVMANQLDADPLFPSWGQDWGRSDASHTRLIRDGKTLYMARIVFSNTLFGILGVWAYDIVDKGAIDLSMIRLRAFQWGDEADE